MPSTESPLVALISATSLASPPVEHALEQVFPAARVWNILDDRLLQDADAAGGLTPHLEDRMRRLIEHAVAEGADAILLTCSVYGPVAHEIAPTLHIPIFGPDDAAFDAVLAGGASVVALVSSVELTLADSLSRLTAVLAARGVGPSVIPIFSAGAMAASRAGDPAVLADALAASVLESGSSPDAVFLAQYSLAPAAERLGARLGLPIITGPERSALALRDALGAVIP